MIVSSPLKRILFFFFLMVCSVESMGEDKIFSVAFDVQVKKTISARSHSYAAYLVLLEKGKSIFSIENKMKAPGTKNFFPRYYKMSGSGDELREVIDLGPGTYNVQVMLKKNRNECEVNDNIGVGVCFPLENDILCSPMTLEIDLQGSISGKKRIECEIPDAV